MEWLLIVGVFIVSFIGMYVLKKYVESAERVRMCEAWANVCKECPDCYVKAAEYISEQWIQEMEKMGVDFGRKN